MLAAMDVVPGHGIDFTALGTVLLSVLALYVASSVFGWLQGYLLNGVVQRTVLPAARRGRGQAAPAAAALLRQPAARRAAQPGHQRHRQRRRRRLQQTLSQLLTSLLTVIGVLVMMFVISPLLALIALVTIPLSMLVTGADRQALAEAVRRAVDAHRRAQRPDRGGVHRPRAGQGVRPAARGRGRRSREKNEELYEASFGAQFISGHHHAGDDVHREPQLRRHRRRRRPAGRVRRDDARRRAGVHPVLAAVHPAADPARLDGQPAAVGRRVGRAGVRAARRRGAVARPGDAPVPPSPAAAGSSSSTSSFRYDPEKPLIEDLSLVAEPGQTVAIVGPTGAGKTTLVNLIMRFYELDARPDHPRRRRHRRA